MILVKIYVCNTYSNFFKFVWHFLRNYKLFLFGVFIASVACGFYGPFFSLLMKKIINSLPEVKQSGNYFVLIKLSSLFVLNFVIFDHITWRFISFLNLKYLPVIKNQITKETFEFTLGHSHSFFGKQSFWKNLKTNWNNCR